MELPDLAAGHIARIHELLKGSSSLIVGASYSASVHAKNVNSRTYLPAQSVCTQVERFAHLNLARQFVLAFDYDHDSKRGHSQRIGKHQFPNH